MDEPTVLDLLKEHCGPVCTVCRLHADLVPEIDEAWRAIQSGELGNRAGFQTLATAVAKKRSSIKKHTLAKHINHAFPDAGIK